ncbi:hypothetical protein NFI96_002919 [Prochilodus magdalenae]|nr:hypothetical protein NFI96_002919 [Prochilodus magdalenae]
MSRCFSRQPQMKEQSALCNVPEEAECLTVPKYKRDLVHKLKVLRQELSQAQPQAGHCRIEVCREEIFEVSTWALISNTCLWDGGVSVRSVGPQFEV